MHKKQAFVNKKKHKKIRYRDNWQQNKYLLGQKTSKKIVSGLEPEKVENHCFRPLLL